jgi:hypothetical protein
MAITLPLDYLFEIYVNRWIDITTDAHEPAGVVISRGGASESDRPPPQKCRFTLDNPSGDYSPRNAGGPYFGYFGQNTPFRLTYRRARDTAARTVSNGWGTSDTGQAWTSDLTTGGAVAGDFNVTPGALKHTVQGTNLFRNSYMATPTYENIDVQVDFSHSVVAPVTGASINAGIILRGTATNNYYGAWLQASSLGTMRVILVDKAGNVMAGPVDIAGLTYAANTTYRIRAQVENQTLRIKAWLASANEPYAWQLSGHDEGISGLGWVGLTSGTSAGNTNTKPYTTTYSNLTVRHPRFAGELADIDVDWQESENTIRAVILAAGIRRRLGQGVSPLDSTMRRGNLYATPTPVAYWPAEDDVGSTVLASGLPNGRTMAISGSITLASSSSFAASRPLPVLKGCYLDGLINPYTVPSPNAMQLRWLMIAPTTPEIPDVSYVIDLHNTGTAGLWRVMYTTGGGLRLQVWSNAFTGGADLLDTGAIAFGDIRGKLLLCSLELTQSGGNVSYNLATLEVGQTVGGVYSGTLNSVTINVATRVFVDPLKVCSGLAIGHMAVHSAVTSLFQLSSELNAFTGEAAGVRMQRLCAQRGVPFSYFGDITTTPAMGAQLPNDLLALLDECADVDMGVLFEPAGEVGFEYRTRGSMLNQSVTLDLDYAQGHVQPGFKPVDNDEQTRNDIKLSRLGGSSVRATLDVGPKSTLDPAAGGVGRYDSQETVNPRYDGQLIDLAYWLLWLGTVNAARYPNIEVELANDQMLNAGKLDAALAVSICDLMTVSNPPAKHCSDQISQLVRGYIDTVRPFQWTLAFNGVPASPYNVLESDTAGMAIANDTTTLTGGPGGTYSTVATSLQFASTGDLWSTAAGDYPVDIKLNGEVVRVTAMSGASSPQTATVTRSINSVVKTQPNGTAVTLARPAIPG